MKTDRPSLSDRKWSLPDFTIAHPGVLVAGAELMLSTPTAVLKFYGPAHLIIEICVPEGKKIRRENRTNSSLEVSRARR
jgi:hypothetical protein